MNSFGLSAPVRGTATLALDGDWSIYERPPSVESFRTSIEQLPPIQRLVIDASKLHKWDTALLIFVSYLERFGLEKGIAIDAGALPAEARRLIDLAAPGLGHEPSPRDAARRSYVRSLGEAAIGKAEGLSQAIAFVGSGVIAFGSLLRGRARCRATDVFSLMEECGARALPIVGIISLLVGMIFSFVGAIQLKQFGADIYDANLVAVAMSREMAAVMTGIVLTGRTGAAFAAQIGAMQGNEEIDALSTLGISSIEFLVLPRMLALILMTPLLCIYSNALGLTGGYVVAMGTLNVTSTAYVLQTQSAITLTDLSIGLVKSVVFGFLIAITGCLRGMQAGRSAAGVGTATTSAVVSGILAIIVTDAVFAVILNMLGL